MIMRILIGIQLLLTLLGQVVAASQELLLQKLCQSEAANLTSIAQLRELIETVELAAADEIECPQQVKHSILDLKPIIEVESGGVCSLESFDRIADYYDLHVHEKSWLKKLKQSKEVRRVPLAVRRLFIAYGLQVSKLCRVSLMENLAAAAAANSNISEDDVKLVTSWIDDDDQNYKSLIGREAKLENLLLLGDLASRHSRTRQSRSKKKKRKDWDRRVTAASVPAEAKVKIDQLKARCATKFKPIYAQLIVPLVQLSYLGFSYIDRELADEFSQFEQSAVYKDWFKIVFVCESILSMKVVSIKDDRVATRFLTEENLEQLEREQKLELNELTVPRPNDYKLIVRIDPEVNLLDPRDEQLLKSIKNYNPRANQSVKLLARLAKNVSNLLNSEVRGRKIRFGLDDLVSGDRLKNPSAKFGQSSDKSNKILRHIKKALRAAGVWTFKAIVTAIVCFIGAILYPFYLLYLVMRSAIEMSMDALTNGRYPKNKEFKYLYT